MDRNTRLFLYDYEWDTLTYLINDDYLDIKKKQITIYQKNMNQVPVKWLFKRYDDASEKTGKITRLFEKQKKQKIKTNLKNLKKKFHFM